jgi:hypothetical protein
MLIPSFWFVCALYVAWVSFTWVYFLLEPFFKPADAAGVVVRCCHVSGEHGCSSAYNETRDGFKTPDSGRKNKK